MNAAVPEAVESPTQDGVEWVAVRAFCAFVAKAGDLDLRFTPAPTAEQGQAGHAAVTARRGPDYRREVPIGAVIDGLGLRGRIDGLTEAPPALEEIKTFRGAVEHIPNNHRALHWAQLKIYGALYCRTRAVESITLRLVLFDIDRKEETVEADAFTADDLDAFLTAAVAEYRAWAEVQRAHRQCRDAALRRMAFPHTGIPPGQQRLMDAGAGAIEAGEPLLAQAPTGVGKTIATLFPALRALGDGQVDKVFYLTAKTSGRAEAVKALDSLDQPDAPLPLRVLELTARSWACEHPDKACHGDACPLARGFYDRLPAAREAAGEESRLRPERLRRVALDHDICPYYLGQEMARWSDVVIGDVNYYFDQTALLHALTRQNRWQVAVLADEAHNLIDRGRTMYSATVSQATLRNVQRAAPGALATALTDLERAWASLAGPEEDSNAQALDQPPPAFVEALGTVAARLSAYLADRPDHGDDTLLEFHFAVLGFLRLAETFGAHSFCDLERDTKRHGLFGERRLRLSIRNVVPAPHLAPRLGAARSVIAFSATLTPPDFYRRMLGFPDTTPWCEAPSHFGADQLDVRLVTCIPTAFHRRAESARPIARRIAAQYRRRPGNYFAFFSSFAYLDLVADAFAREFPDIPALRQTAGMGEGERNALLARFQRTEGLVGFAVLGGVFAEGVDLLGDRLIGAFVTTLGLPVFDAHNQRTAARIDELFGDGCGYPYTYLYPGLRKVAQAAGRVIRSTGDRGTVHLIDPRYARAEVRALLPAWWRREG